MHLTLASLCIECSDGAYRWCRGDQEVEERLKAELESSLDACAVEVNGFIKPLEEATLAVVERIKDAESRRAVLAAELEQLKQRAANIE